jgi:hypothetical protein
MKKLLAGLLTLGSITSFANCTDLNEAGKVCLQSIMDSHARIDFTSVKLSASLVERPGKKTISECYYTLNKTVVLPNEERRNVSIVGTNTYDAVTCEQLSGKAVSVAGIGQQI